MCERALTIFSRQRNNQRQTENRKQKTVNIKQILLLCLNMVKRGGEAVLAGWRWSGIIWGLALTLVNVREG